MRIRQRHLLPLLAVLVLGGCGGSGGSAARPAHHDRSAQRATATGPPKYAAPARLNPASPAPDFTLRDSTGRRVTLSDFRGKAVLLTFIYDHCPDTCPLMIGHLHAALDKLGARANEAQVVAVSVDPKGDTPATVKAFLAAHEMTGRMEYLIGSKRRLTPVWRAYNIGVKGTPEQREGKTSSQPVAHSALVYGITGSGQVTTVYPANFKPQWVVHDVPLLAHA